MQKVLDNHNVKTSTLTHSLAVSETPFQQLPLYQTHTHLTTADKPKTNTIPHLSPPLNQTRHKPANTHSPDQSRASHSSTDMQYTHHQIVVFYHYQNLTNISYGFALFAKEYH